MADCWLVDYIYIVIRGSNNHLLLKMMIIDGQKAMADSLPDDRLSWYSVGNQDLSAFVRC
jgi:hypothetical protein